MPEVNQRRRSLLKFIGTGAVAMAFPKQTLLASSGYVPRIGLQLYTVRKSIETDFEGTMRKVADIGFRGIESYALPANITLARAAGVFKDVGLNVVGMHTQLPVGAERDAVLRMAESYDCDRVIFAGWPEGEKYKTLDAIQHMVDVYNETGRFLEERGLHFGLHNHWWEFEMHDGYYPFYYLLDHCDDRVFFEIDTYWVKTGGKDPAKVVSDFGARAPLLHIKDGPAIKGDSAFAQVPAGEGVMDFPAIFKAGAENIQWMIVEFDEYEKDIVDGMRKSYAYLTKNGLAEGRI
jgi:sugar phosphate isomerase/epimerase